MNIYTNEDRTGIILIDDYNRVTGVYRYDSEAQKKTKDREEEDATHALTVNFKMGEYNELHLYFKSKDARDQIFNKLLADMGIFL